MDLNVCSLTSPSSGSDLKTGYGHAKAGAWTVYAKTLKDHPCYAPYVGYDDYVDWPLVHLCLAYTKWSFSGSVSAKAASTPTITPIKPQNVAPMITSDKQTDTGYIGHTYRYDVNATDGNGDALTYSVTQFVNSTSGTKIMGWEMDSATGVLTWGPLTATNMGKYNVTVMVTDGRGGSDT